MEFSEKLADLRRRSGDSQEQLAERLGVTRQSVSKWEGGAAVPELQKLVALSELFGVSVDYLVKDYIEEPDAPGGRELAPARLEETVEELARYVRGYAYTSKTRLFGLPLVSIRFSRRLGRDCVAKGILAIGNVAVGVVAVGAGSVGVFSLGAFSGGLVAVGALALGGISVGALAVGLLALGSCAFGIWSCGVVAVGREVAVGIAASAPVAVGQNAVGRHTLLWGSGLSRAHVEAFLLEHRPDLWHPLARLLSFFGAHIK